MQRSCNKRCIYHKTWFTMQRLLEDDKLCLNHVFNKARFLHEAQKNAESYEV